MRCIGVRLDSRFGTDRWNMVMAVLVQLERHEGHPDQEGRPSYVGSVPSTTGGSVHHSVAQPLQHPRILHALNKKQQMRWNRMTVQPFLDVRTAVLDGTLEDA